MSYRGFSKSYLNKDGSSIREDLLGGLHTDPATIEKSVLIVRLQHRMAGFTGVFGDNKDGEGRGDAYRFAMEYADEHGSLPSEIPEIMEEVYR
tara:strand:+ start:1607 stop:1885 length:279 start_codon:yes stop_codon:yes gene_type:complete